MVNYATIPLSPAKESSIASSSMNSYWRTKGNFQWPIKLIECLGLQCLDRLEPDSELAEVYCFPFLLRKYYVDNLKRALIKDHPELII